MCSRWATPLAVAVAAVAFVARHKERRDGHPEPDPGGRALPDQRGAGVPAPLRGVLGDAEPPRAVRQLPPEDLRRVERVDDVELVARSGVARRLPAARPRGVDERRVRHARRRPTARPRPRTTRSRCRGSARRRSTSATASSRCRGRGRCWTRSARAVTCRRTTSTTCPLRNVKLDAATGVETAVVDPKFNPTSDNGTGVAFATLDTQFRNTESGKAGIFCAVCHSYAATRDTPFHNYAKAPDSYTPAVGRQARDQVVLSNAVDILAVADPATRNLGYAIGAGAYRLSPHALAFPERIGPMLAGNPPPGDDGNTSSVFGQAVAWQQLDQSKHKGMHSALYVRAEMCAACHDVTNALPIKNPLGRWVGGFPIERTYTEWLSSRYADRPGNANFDPPLQARLPVVPHAAGLRPAGHREHALRRRAAAADPARGRRHRRKAAAVVHAPLRRRQRAGAAPDRQGRRRDRKRRALPRAVDVQLLVGRPQEPLLARLLDQPRQEGRVRAAAAAGVGSPAQRPLHDAAGPGDRRRRAAARRSRSPSPTPAAATTSRPASPRDASPGSRSTPSISATGAELPIRDSFWKRTSVGRRRPDDARDDRSRVPGLQVGAAGGLGRSVLDPVQGGGVAGQRLPDAGPALRRAAEHGDERARAADRR